MDSKKRRRILQRTKSVSGKTWDSYGTIEKMKKKIFEFKRVEDAEGTLDVRYG